MKRTPGLRTFITVCLFACSTAGLAGAARADAGTDSAKDKKVEKHRIVVVNDDGHERVIEGDGPLVRRGFLGVGLTEMTPELRTHFGAPEDSGVMVSRIESDSPAERAGLKVGDIITGIDGKDVATSWDVRAKVRDYDDGQQVPMEVWRGGKVQTLTATMQQRERPEMDMGPLFFKTKDGGDVLLRLNPEHGGPLAHFMSDSDGPEIHLQRLRSPREAELEKKIQELAKRLDELEKQLKQKK